MIVLMAGLPGSGKTTLARELANLTGGRILSKDTIRHSLFAENEIEYSSRQDDFCMQVMLQTAEYLLSQEPQRIIFLDGRPFSRRYQIENVVTFAETLHEPWRIIECVCSEESAQHRLNGDESSGAHPAGNRNYGLYLAIKDRFEAITRLKLLVDTDQSLELSLRDALAYLR